MKHFSKYEIKKKRFFWVPEVWFKLFFRYECNAFNLDFFCLKFCLLPLIWPLCIFFASQYFWNLHRKFFFVKKTFWKFVYCYNFFFVKQKILLRTPYKQKVRDPSFLRPKFDVRRPPLKVEKFWIWNRCCTP